MSLQLHRPDGKGGLEPRAVTDDNWHKQLRSPRWGASLKGGRLPKLDNPEMNPTSTLRSVLFWLALGVYFFTAGGSLTTTDAVVAFDVTRNIVEHGTVATSGNLLGMDAFRGVDGRYYSPFGLLQSVYNIPFYVAGTSFVEVSGIAVGAGQPRLDAYQNRDMSLGALAVARAWLTKGAWLTKDRRSVGHGGNLAAGVAAALLCVPAVIGLA